jgi:hypothetical protein
MTSKKSPPKKHPLSISKTADLLDYLKKDFPKEIRWYRGQCNKSWGLLPSLCRMHDLKKDFAGTEQILMEKFKQNAVSFLSPRPTNYWEWLFLMQHFGVKTRLLDWTESPLVALYFAVIETPSQKDTDAALWVLLPKELNKIANIEPSSSTKLSIPAFEDELIMNRYLPQTIRLDHSTKASPVAAIALRDNPRIHAQQGVFTLTHRNADAIQDICDPKQCWKYIIPKNKKALIRNELKELNITTLSLFPELQYVAQHTMASI